MGEVTTDNLSYFSGELHMNVLIFRNSDGKQVGKYQINLAGQNYIASETEFFAEAWRCAVEDNLVNEEKQDKFTFKLEK
jgi:hypothetical protein